MAVAFVVLGIFLATLLSWFISTNLNKVKKYNKSITPEAFSGKISNIFIGKRIPVLNQELQLYGPKENSVILAFKDSPDLYHCAPNATTLSLKAGDIVEGLLYKYALRDSETGFVYYYIAENVKIVQT